MQQQPLGKYAIKLIKLESENYRGFKKLSLDFHEQTSILVGENRAGKSSILFCLVNLFSFFINRLNGDREESKSDFSFSELDISNGEEVNQNSITLSFGENEVRGKVTKSISLIENKQDVANSQVISDVIEEIHKTIKTEKGNLPLVVFYPVNRAILGVSLKPPKNVNQPGHDRLSVYDGALGGNQLDFHLFFEWFRSREDWENEIRLDGEPEFRDLELNSVRDAIGAFFPGFSQLRVRHSPLRMTLKKGKDELDIKQLSDGEKCTLAMVGDLARRLALANPDFKTPLGGSAIVMIDEIDLHLHPSWQREIVPSLEKTFPHCQFILTSHSPQVLSHVKPECIFILNRDEKEGGILFPESSYGLDSNRILEEIMDVPKRPELIKNELSNLFLSLKQEKIEEAKQLLNQLQEKIGDDSELVKASVLIRRKEVLGQ